MEKKIISATLLLAISSLVSRILGLMRDRILAGKFGILTDSGSLDAYYAAFQIPDTTFQLLIMGAISAAFVPMFSSYYHGNEKERAWKFFSETCTAVTLLMVVICALLFIGMPWITPFFVPGFSGEKMRITSDLTRIMLVSPIFFGISSMLQGVGNSVKRYAYFALAPIMYNTAIIVSALLYSAEYGVYAIAWGVSIGALLHALIQLPVMLNTGSKIKIVLNMGSHDTREFIKIALPRVLGVGVTQLNQLIAIAIASTFGAGSIAALNFAFNIQSFPLGIIGISVSIVAFGIFSQQMAEGKKENMLGTLREKIEHIAIYIIPATCGIFLLRNEIVNVFLRSGNFSEEDSILTAALLGIFSMSLIAQNLIPLLSRYYFAQKDTVTPMKISILGLALNATGSIIFGKILNLGIKGVVTSFVISTMISLLLMIHWITKKTKTQLIDARERRELGKIMVASVGMSTIIIGWQKLMEGWISEFYLLNTSKLVGSSIIGYLIFRMFLGLLRHENWRKFMH
jgi:putative peptidoglycan lipid II flippase